MSRWLAEHRWYRALRLLGRLEAIVAIARGRGAIVGVTFRRGVYLGPGTIVVTGCHFEGGLIGEGRAETCLSMLPPNKF